MAGMALSSMYSFSYAQPKTDSVYYQGRMVSRNYMDNREFETYFMPGAGYSYYKFQGADSVGNFGGFTIDYLIYAKSHQNDDFGPSHVKVYSRLNMNKSDRSGMGNLFVYTAGLQMSIEKNPKRNFLIPYFGMEAGGMSNKILGSTFMFNPIAGVSLIATKNIYVNIHGGYIYPVGNYDLLSGYNVQATAQFAMW